MKSARSQLSGALSDARGGLVRRQSTHHASSRMRGTQVVSKMDQTKLAAQAHTAAACAPDTAT